ncbi:hypothetical protein [Piscinibacter defluvii]|uniref:hypothetical protein n=1 Tax=Piscinibacter defluvii TaxID=1796922 RepID=UPI000FDD23E5|nr:hypothetical protein [Piscinibacter defluvii]
MLAYPITQGLRAPLRGVPRLDIRTGIAEPDTIPRRGAGVVRLSGGNVASFRVEREAVCIEHSLFGPLVRQRLPIVRMPFGTPRERLVCRCGDASVLFYARPGVGFVCKRCAGKFCDSPEQADVHDLLHERQGILRRLGLVTGRGEWVHVKPTKLSADERAELKAELDRVEATLRTTILEGDR